MNVRILFILFLAVTSLLPAQSPTELQTLLLSFDREMNQEIQTLRGSMITSLDEKYLAALTRGMKTAQQAGNTTEAAAFKAELDQLAAVRENPRALIPQSRDDLPPGVFKIKSVYLAEVGKFEAEVGRRTQVIVAKYERSLEDLSVRLTQQKKLEEASLVASERNGLSMARIKIAGVKQGILKDGEKAFLNRAYVWMDVPKSLSGLPCTLGAGNTAPPYIIEVLQPGMLHVVLGERPGAEEGIEVLKGLGFKKSAQKFSYSDGNRTGMLVFSRYVIQSFTLKPALGSFTGFVVIGNLD